MPLAIDRPILLRQCQKSWWCQQSHRLATHHKEACLTITHQAGNISIRPRMSAMNWYASPPPHKAAATVTQPPYKATSDHWPKSSTSCQQAPAQQEAQIQAC